MPEDQWVFKKIKEDSQAPKAETDPKSKTGDGGAESAAVAEEHPEYLSYVSMARRWTWEQDVETEGGVDAYMEEQRKMHFQLQPLLTMDIWRSGYKIFDRNDSSTL